MTTIHLVRHARKEGSSAGDPSISQLGRIEAKATALALADLEPGALYSSPLRRTRETAQIFARYFGLQPVDDPLLRERANWGDLPGQSLAEFFDVWERCCADRTYTPSVGDASVAAGRRLETFLSALADGSTNVVVSVTHGGILADFLQNICDPAELSRINPAFARTPYSGDVMRECSITTVRRVGGSINVVRIADASHLAEEGDFG